MERSTPRDMIRRATERAAQAIADAIGNGSRRTRGRGHGDAARPQATNAARHHLHEHGTGEARRLAALRRQEVYPFSHVAERRARHHRDR